MARLVGFEVAVIHTSDPRAYHAAMSDVREPMVLSDEVVDEPALIGPIEIRVQGRWNRVEAVLELESIPHGPVTYRWRIDSTGDPALFVEVPVTNELPEEERFRARDSIHETIAELRGDRAVYVHFVGLEDVEAVGEDA